MNNALNWNPQYVDIQLVRDIALNLVCTDIHIAVAACLFDVDYTEVTPDMRYAAKVVNFGWLYGKGGGYNQ